MATETLTARTRPLAFPFRMTREGAAITGRQGHVRSRIAALLFTLPGDRVFLPGFGIGVAQLLFLPMTASLWSRVQSSLAANLAKALAGEVLADSITVTVGPKEDDSAVLRIVIRYQLAALNLAEEAVFDLADGTLAVPGDQP